MTDGAVVVFAVLGVRVDEEEDLSTNVTIVAAYSESTVFRVSQNTFHSDTTGDFAVRVSALTGMEQGVDSLLYQCILTSLVKQKIVYVLHYVHIYT